MARKSGSKGHLSVQDREAIIEDWHNRDRNRGAVSAIANRFEVSHVSVSNLILTKTGIRPTYHQCPATEDRGEK